MRLLSPKKAMFFLILLGLSPGSCLHAQIMPGTYYELLESKNGGYPATYLDCVRYRYNYMSYKTEIESCSPPLCGSSVDVVQLIDNAAEAWQGGYFRVGKLIDSQNAVHWNCTDRAPWPTIGLFQPLETKCGEYIRFNIELFAFNDAGQIYEDCDNSCSNSPNLWTTAAHEFGHAVGLQHPVSQLQTIMKQNDCATSLGFDDYLARDFLYPEVISGLSWGELKSLYADNCYTPTSMLPSNDFASGFLEPRSSRFPRLAWNDFADTLGFYRILKSSDGSGTFESIRTKWAGDTVLIDSTASAGHTYDYRVISQCGDMLAYTREMSYGLQMVSELFFYDINGSLGSIINNDTTYVARGAFMIPDGEYLYIASDLKVKKINVSDPHNPIEVGSRDLSYLDSEQSLKDMQIGLYDSHLLVLLSDGLVVIDKTSNALPVISVFSSFLPANCTCVQLAGKGNTAYIAVDCDAGRGIYAINVQNPANPSVWGYYPGFGATLNRPLIALESVGDYLYVDYGGGNSSCTEILKPRVYEPSHSVFFDLICSDHDSLICLARPIDLTALTSTGICAPRGNPAGYYALGKINDSTLSVFGVSDPVNPVSIRSIRAPWGTYDVGGTVEFTHASYAFDDQHLYLGMHRWTLHPWSAVYVYDIFSGSEEPIYAIGDATIGQDKDASVASWGKYLYYFDRARDDRAYHRLQIFEKARGCDPNLNIAGGALSSAYEVNQTMRINWQATGCPTRIDIALVEDGSRNTTIASFKKYDRPNLISGFFDWPANGISNPPDGHTYNIKLLAWNIEGNYDEYTSNAFNILVDIEEYHPKDPNIIVESSLMRGNKRKYPLPGFSTDSSKQSESHFWQLPEDTPSRDGRISITICAPDEAALSIRELRLFLVDFALNSEAPARIEQLLHTLKGSSAIGTGELIDLEPGTSRDFAFALNEERSEGHCRYVLRYGGILNLHDGIASEMPKAIALENPHPNPFNPITSIEFHLPRMAHAKLSIYDVSGRLIRTLEEGRFRPGIYHAVWDGANARGENVASGVYFCRLTVDGKEWLTRKLVLMK